MLRICIHTMQIIIGLKLARNPNWRVCFFLYQFKELGALQFRKKKTIKSFLFAPFSESIPLPHESAAIFNLNMQKGKKAWLGYYINNVFDTCESGVERERTSSRRGKKRKRKGKKWAGCICLHLCILGILLENVASSVIVIYPGMTMLTKLIPSSEVGFNQYLRTHIPIKKQELMGKINTSEDDFFCRFSSLCLFALSLSIWATITPRIDLCLNFGCQIFHKSHSLDRCLLLFNNHLSVSRRLSNEYVRA